MANIERILEDEPSTDSAPKSPAQSGSAKDLVKLVGGALLLAGSVGLMVHRMPKRQFVEVHEDKPRPPRPKADADSPDAPAPKVGAMVAKAQAAAQANMKALAAPAKPGAKSPEAITLVTTDKPAVSLDLAEACAAEAPLLCYHVPEGRLARCLQGYEDYLRKSCLEALPGATASRR